MFNILTVDDDLMICDVISDFLKERGYGVQTAQTGEEALEMISREKPDLRRLSLGFPHHRRVRLLVLPYPHRRAPIVQPGENLPG